MEVDRVSHVGGIRQEANPPWRREKTWRRKFVEEVGLSDSEAGETEAEASDVEEEEKREGGLNLIA